MLNYVLFSMLDIEDKKFIIIQNNKCNKLMRIATYLDIFFEFNHYK